MKWSRPNPKNGDIRIVRKFLWLPTTLGKQTRWLERAWVLQRYVDGQEEGGFWKDLEWSEPPNKVEGD